MLKQSSVGWTCECCGAILLATRSPLNAIVKIAAAPERKDRYGYPRGKLPEWRIRKIQLYIDEQLRHHLTVQSMAAYLGLTSGYFSRAFRESIGSTPHRFLMIRRVSRARDLLRATTLSVADIAAECGFSDQAHLTKWFGNYFGMPPGVWRRYNMNYPPASSEAPIGDDRRETRPSPHETPMTPLRALKTRDPDAFQKF